MMILKYGRGLGKTVFYDTDLLRQEILRTYENMTDFQKDVAVRNMTPIISVRGRYSEGIE